MRHGTSFSNVMRGLVLPDFAPHQLKAATWVRTEVTGPQSQRLEHTGKDGEPLTVSISITRADTPKES
jgi:hypothetical protein